jgi:hypothetical protein
MEETPQYFTGYPRTPQTSGSKREPALFQNIAADKAKNASETVAVPADDGGVWLYLRNEDPA